MLDLGAIAAPDQSPTGRRSWLAVNGHRFAERLHLQLLEIVGQLAEAGRIGRNTPRRIAHPDPVPDIDQALEDRHVALERRRGKMLVHLLRPITERLEY